MSRIFFARLAAAALLLAGCWIAYTQTQAQPPKLTLSKVKDDLYMIEGDGGNVAVYVTSEGVILVDDKYEQDHDGIVAQVKSVTPLPVKYVLSTHYHADHSGGKNGLTRVGPFSKRILVCSNRVVSPPIPLPTTTAISCWFVSLICSPEVANASRLAATANWAKRS